MIFFIGQVAGLRKAFQQLRMVSTGDAKEADADDAFAQHLGQVCARPRFMFFSLPSSELKNKSGRVVGGERRASKGGHSIQIIRCSFGSVRPFARFDGRKDNYLTQNIRCMDINSRAKPRGKH